MIDEPKIERMSAKSVWLSLYHTQRAMAQTAECIAFRYGEDNDHAKQLMGAALLISEDWMVAIQKEIDDANEE